MAQLQKDSLEILLSIISGFQAASAPRSLHVETLGHRVQRDGFENDRLSYVNFALGQQDGIDSYSMRQCVVVGLKYDLLPSEVQRFRPGNISIVEACNLITPSTYSRIFRTIISSSKSLL